MTSLPRTGKRNPATRILIIDDEVDMLTNYQRLLSRAGHDCLTLTDASRLEQILGEYQPNLVITDLVMPGCSGMDVLARVRKHDSEIPVIMVTAHGSVENAVEAMRNLAFDYLTKPFSMGDLLGKIQRAISQTLIRDDLNVPSRTLTPDEEWRREIIGVSPAFQESLNLVRKVARTDVNVLILGESGTGKEVMARAIHRLSQRRKEIFVPVDCASLPENLLESELFGYRKGAFTGATSDKMGLFEFAHKGTLFLDEIGDMPVTLQSKLLRVLQERRFRPVGGREEIEVDVRIIAATNSELVESVRRKTFRSDLYYRLNVVTLHLPSLRERPEDIPLLSNYFLQQFTADNSCGVTGISSAALDLLQAYPWPGNVRELQNMIEHAATLACDSQIQVPDLPKAIRSNTAAPSEVPENGSNMAPASDRSLSAKEKADKEHLFAAKNTLVGDFERRYITRLLVQNGFNISKAAAAAGCHRRTLYRMVHRYNIDLEWMQKERGAMRLNRPRKTNGVG